MTSIDRAQREVQKAVNATIRIAETSEPTGLFAAEQQLWTAVMALGRALLALFLAHHAARPRATQYTHAGAQYALQAPERLWRSSSIGTRFGKVVFKRPIGRRIGRSKANADLPVDRELGLCGGFSLGTVTLITRLCAMMAFAQARDTFRSFSEWSPSSRATLRMVDAVGAEARPFLESAPAPDNDGDILVIQVDGRGAPMISQHEHQERSRPHVEPPRLARRARRIKEKVRRLARPRRKKGDKSKNSKLAVVGVIYTLRSTPEGLEGPINKRVYGTFESHEALMIWLRREADKRGYAQKFTLFLADGSPHIWRLQQRYFGEVDAAALDWYHVAEKIWEAGACLFTESSAELAEWVSARLRELRRGRLGALHNALAELLSKVPRTATKRRKRLLDIMLHLGDHRPHMQYHELRRMDLDIGTGPVEGAVRNVIAVRLDGPGMRWGRERAEMILYLRCVLVNGQWDTFVKHLAAENGVTLQAQPVPATPYDAQRKAA